MKGSQLLCLLLSTNGVEIFMRKNWDEIGYLEVAEVMLYIC